MKGKFDFSPTKKKADTVQEKRRAGEKVWATARDYSVFHFTFAQMAESVLLFMLLDAAVSYLFYRSFIAFLLLSPLFYFFLKERKKELMRRRRRQMSTEFLDGMKSVSTSLQTGYAPENAFREALREMRRIYPDDSFIVTEFSRIVTQVSFNYPLEPLLTDLGKRSGIEEIRDFADVFSTARRTGGDLILIVRNTASSIEQREATLLEIETVLTGKQTEQKIMSVIPLVILGYVDLTSPELIGKMYGNATGIISMSIALILYSTAFLWGKKIMRFNV